MDLQGLIDAPGHGKHIPILKTAGKWDEWIGLPYKKYTVVVTATIVDNYLISARSEDEAEDLSCKKLEDEHDGDVEIDDVEVEECD